MAVGAGDAISAMAAYLSRHSEELLAGTRVLTLSTRELARVTARLQQLARLSELGGGPGGQTPNDWSRQLDHWHASDLEYLRRLEYVRALLEGLRTLRVDEHDLHAGDGNPPTPPVTTSRMTSHERRRQQLPSALSLLSLAPFASLARLELRGCDLAAATRQPIWDGNLVRGLREVRAHLEELHLRGCVGTLAMIFVAEGESATSAHDKPPAATWPRLRSLAYVGGELLGGETDASVGACCPELTSLDLRRNGLHATDRGAAPTDPPRPGLQQDSKRATALPFAPRERRGAHVALAARQQASIDKGTGASQVASKLGRGWELASVDAARRDQHRGQPAATEEGVAGG